MSGRIVFIHLTAHHFELLFYDRAIFAVFPVAEK
jgi:hypothetical protein